MKDLMLPFLERLFGKEGDPPIKRVKRSTDYVYEDNGEWDPEPRPEGDE